MGAAGRSVGVFSAVRLVTATNSCRSSDTGVGRIRSVDAAQAGPLVVTLIWRGRALVLHVWVVLARTGRVRPPVADHLRASQTAAGHLQIGVELAQVPADLAAIRVR